MKILHILRSEPDEMVRKFMDIINRNNMSTEVTLFKEHVRYDELIKQIFENDKVVSWW
jgi:hypothetical protein